MSKGRTVLMSILLPRTVWTYDSDACEPLKTFGRSRRNVHFDDADPITTSNSTSSSSALGATYMPPPYAFELAIATDHPYTSCAVPSTTTWKLACFQPASAFSAAYR